jgi:hypothetical protein
VTAQLDTIAWKLTTNGSYSANSAYKIQFQGSYANHDWKRIWTAKVDGKCKLFGWLILQNRMWTADRIVKHGGDANSICVLCRTHPETALHMLATCSYSKQVWQGLSAWTGTALCRPPHHSYRRAEDLVEKHARRPKSDATNHLHESSIEWRYLPSSLWNLSRLR